MVNDETHTQIFITLALSFNKYVWFIVCCFLFLLYAGAVDAYASAATAACAKGHRAAPLSAALTQTLLSVYLAVPATCTLDYTIYLYSSSAGKCITRGATPPQQPPSTTT